MRKLYILCVIGLVGIVFGVAFAQEESITFTTYYPAPYGVYREMRSQRMAIGGDPTDPFDEDYYQASEYCWEGTCSTTIDPNADLVVAGNVGIGTASPDATLHLVLPTAEPDSANAFEIWDWEGPDASPFVIKGDGNVGIGTTSPGVKLDVKGPSSGQLRIFSDTDLVLGGGKQQQSEIQLYGGWGGGALPLGAIRSYTVGSAPVDQGILSFATANNGPPVDRLTIDQNGNVSIGATLNVGSSMLLPYGDGRPYTCNRDTLGTIRVWTRNGPNSPTIMSQCLCPGGLGGSYDDHVVVCMEKWSGSSYIFGWCCIQ